MRLITLSQIVKFGERQTGTQRRLSMLWQHLNGETVHCLINPMGWSRTFEKAIARKGGSYE